MLTWRPDDGSQAEFSYVSQSVTGAATALAPALAAVAGQTNYVCGIGVNGLGATAAIIIVINITGVLGGTIQYHYSVPAGVGVVAPLYIVGFTCPIAASAANTAITFNVPSFGAGNTIAEAYIYGFRR